MYDELVNKLRKQVKCNKKIYPQGAPFETLLLDLAADAIEELNKRNCELLFQVCQAEALIDYYQTGRMVSNEPPKEE